jgi:hypothetical protein
MASRMFSHRLECSLMVVPATLVGCDCANAGEMTLAIAELFSFLSPTSPPDNPFRTYGLRPQPTSCIQASTLHGLPLASPRRLRPVSHELECPSVVVPTALAGCDRADASEMTLSTAKDAYSHPADFTSFDKLLITRNDRASATTSHVYERIPNCTMQLGAVRYQEAGCNM